MPTQNEQQPKATKAGQPRREVKEVFVHDISGQPVADRPVRSRGGRAGVLAVAGLAGAVALAGVAYALGKNENPNYRQSSPTPAGAGLANPTPGMSPELTPGPFCRFSQQAWKPSLTLGLLTVKLFEPY